VIIFEVDLFPTISSKDESMLWKIVLILGILGVLLGFAVTAISVALPIVNEGRTSWGEAAYGIIQPNITDENRSSVFGPEVEVPDDAPAQAKLLGFTGRKPS